jgi:hypothetical protein
MARELLEYTQYLPVTQTRDALVQARKVAKVDHIIMAGGDHHVLVELDAENPARMQNAIAERHLSRRATPDDNDASRKSRELLVATRTNGDELVVGAAHNVAIIEANTSHEISVTDEVILSFARRDGPELRAFNI